jgi:hypothetical protein
MLSRQNFQQGGLARSVMTNKRCQACRLDRHCQGLQQSAPWYCEADILKFKQCGSHQFIPFSDSSSAFKQHFAG